MFFFCIYVYFFVSVAYTKYISFANFELLAEALVTPTISTLGINISDLIVSNVAINCDLLIINSLIN